MQEAAELEVQITEADLHKALQEGRASLPPKERSRLSAMYDRFRGARAPGPKREAVGQLSTLA